MFSTKKSGERKNGESWNVFGEKETRFKDATVELLRVCRHGTSWVVKWEDARW